MSQSISKIMQSFFNEYNVLQKKVELLDIILGYYDVETKTFIIPQKWKNEHRISKEKLSKLGNTPNQFIHNKIIELLPQDEVDDLYNKF